MIALAMAMLATDFYGGVGLILPQGETGMEVHANGRKKKRQSEDSSWSDGGRLESRASARENGRVQSDDRPDRSEKSTPQDAPERSAGGNAPQARQDTGPRGRAQDREKRSGEVDRDPQEPPRTIVEAVGRLVASKSTTATAAGTGTTGASATATGARTGPVASPPRNAVRTAPLPAAAINLDYSQTPGKSVIEGQVLARRLTTEDLERIRALGFTMHGSTSLSQLPTTVTRLIPPVGTSADDAVKLLSETIASAKFGTNKLYRIYRSAQQEADAPARRTRSARAPGSAVPCEGDRCFGRELIEWQPRLAACSAQLRIGVIDTDVDYEHPALQSARLRSANFIPKGSKPAPTWHGTGVLTLLAGDPTSGTPGLVPEAEFFVASVFFIEDDGGFATDTFSVVNALDSMDAWGVHVVNMSFSGPRDDFIQSRIAQLSQKGTVLVAAAGNEGPTALPGYPAAYKQVIAVTAVNKETRNFTLANRGGHIDVAAPGVDIWTAVPRAREGYYSGTSFAAPYVTAVMAALHGASPRRDKVSMLAQVQVRDLGAPGRDPVYGRGLLVAPKDCQPAAPSDLAQPGRPSRPATAGWPATVVVGGTSTSPGTGATAGGTQVPVPASYR